MQVALLRSKGRTRSGKRGRGIGAVVRVREFGHRHSEQFRRGIPERLGEGGVHPNETVLGIGEHQGNHRVLERFLERVPTRGPGSLTTRAGGGVGDGQEDEPSVGPQRAAADPDREFGSVPSGRLEGDEPGAPRRSMQRACCPRCVRSAQAAATAKPPSGISTSADRDRTVRRGRIRTTVPRAR